MGSSAVAFVLINVKFRGDGPTIYAMIVSVLSILWAAPKGFREVLNGTPRHSDKGMRSDSLKSALPSRALFTRKDLLE